MPPTVPAAQGPTVPLRPPPAPGPDRAVPVRTPGPAPERPAARPRRGRGFARTCLVLAVLVAVALGVTVYLAFDAVDIVSVDPFGDALNWAGVSGLLALAALVVLVLAVAACVRCVPKGLGVLALLAALVLPLLAAGLAGWQGVVALRENAVDAAGGDPEAAVSQVLDDLAERGIPVEGLRDLVEGRGPDGGGT